MKREALEERQNILSRNDLPPLPGLVLRPFLTGGCAAAKPRGLLPAILFGPSGAGIWRLRSLKNKLRSRSCLRM